MRMLNTARLSAIAVLMAGSMGVAMAAPISDVVTGSGDVVFAATGTASITVTPVTGLTAGSHSNTIVANATATATPGNIAYRWTPDASVQRGTSALDRTISGKTDATNKLDVTSSGPATQSASYPDWYVANAGASTMPITITTTSTPQVVAADTYVVSLDAAVWME